MHALYAFFSAGQCFAQDALTGLAPANWETDDVPTLWYDPGSGVLQLFAARVAGDAAVKVNMALEPAKLEWILRELLKCDDPYQCPHGRATILRFDEEQVKRSFGRYW